MEMALVDAADCENLLNTENNVTFVLHHAPILISNTGKDSLKCKSTFDTSFAEPSCRCNYSL
jgi:hypothetical protein